MGFRENNYLVGIPWRQILRQRVRPSMVLAGAILRAEMACSRFTAAPLNTKADVSQKIAVMVLVTSSTNPSPPNAEHVQNLCDLNWAELKTRPWESCANHLCQNHLPLEAELKSHSAWRTDDETPPTTNGPSQSGI